MPPTRREPAIAATSPLLGRHLAGVEKPAVIRAGPAVLIVSKDHLSIWHPVQEAFHRCLDPVIRARSHQAEREALSSDGRPVRLRAPRNMDTLRLQSPLKQRCILTAS